MQRPGRNASTELISAFFSGWSTNLRLQWAMDIAVVELDRKLQRDREPIGRSIENYISWRTWHGLLGWWITCWSSQWCMVAAVLARAANFFDVVEYESEQTMACYLEDSSSRLAVKNVSLNSLEPHGNYLDMFSWALGHALHPATPPVASSSATKNCTSTWKSLPKIKSVSH